MKNQAFSEEMLLSLRQLLPWGAQTKIAQMLSTPELPISVQDVNQVLHGIKKRYGKCDPSAIIKAAADICRPVNDSQEEAKRAVEEVLGATKEQ